ncbi:MAG: hypothetical protein WBC19_07275 [Pyrinomonadaceae bacterium]|nr:hypothetical protein [Chloracidobacterium sp.]MBP7415776.1 hypothetical protein [Pyrinomonadaceae bacterium]
MKISILLLTLVLSLTAFGTSTSTAADLTGKWSLAADAGGQVIYVAVELKQTGETFTGTTSSDMGAGTIDGGKVTGKNFAATLHATVQGSIVDFAMAGTFEGDSMSGTLNNSQFGSIPFTATKDK